MANITLIWQEEFIGFNFFLFQIIVKSFLGGWCFLADNLLNYVTNYFLEKNNEKFKH